MNFRNPTQSVRLPLRRERVIGSKLPNRIAARRADTKFGCEWAPILLGLVILVACPLGLFFGGQFFLAPEREADLRARGALTIPTRTLEPASMLAPTPAPPTPTPAPVIGKVIERRVNVRAAPNTHAKIVAWLHQNDLITLLARNSDGTWYQVKMLALSEPSWVFAELVEIISGNPATLPAQ